MKIQIGRLITFLMLACGSSALAAGVKISADEMAAFEAVQESFLENCAMCHGSDGIPMLPGVPNFAKSERMEKSDKDLLVIMGQGKDLMPAWEDFFTEQEQLEFLNYVRGIAGIKVFDERCSECHRISHPAINTSFQEPRAAMIGHQGKIEICSGGDIEESISRQELVDVVTYLRSLKNYQE
jgi:mono/diheme cytochrome c family protein